jgi:hypothetical protein
MGTYVQRPYVCRLSWCVNVQIEYGDPPTFVKAAVMAPTWIAALLNAAGTFHGCKDSSHYG